MGTTEKNWFLIDDIETIDSPALVVYADRVKQNISSLTARVSDLSLLRPHVKTNKMSEVCQLMLDAGIRKFKCATIAEAEMLGIIQAPDVLLAYQPVGPKIKRFIQLIKTYPSTSFSCLADDVATGENMNEECIAAGVVLQVFIDVNVGMNRSGIPPHKAFELYRNCLASSNIQPMGLHGYDGHVNDADAALRQQKGDAAFTAIQALSAKIEADLKVQPLLIMGGSPSFTTHLLRPHIEHSPGTFVFWDWGYKTLLPNEPYQLAALVISRVISVVDEHTICADLGHKSVAAENPLPRVYFLNAPDAVPVGQSEEHLVLKVPDSSNYSVGTVLYGVPVHICPTVALYEKAVVIENNKATTEWPVVARNRKITI